PTGSTYPLQRADVWIGFAGVVAILQIWSLVAPIRGEAVDTLLVLASPGSCPHSGTGVASRFVLRCGASGFWRCSALQPTRRGERSDPSRLIRTAPSGRQPL